MIVFLPNFAQFIQILAVEISQTDNRAYCSILQNIVVVVHPLEKLEPYRGATSATVNFQLWPNFGPRVPAGASASLAAV